MNIRLLEQEILSVRQRLMDEMSIIIENSPVGLEAYRSIRIDITYCNYLLSEVRKRYLTQTG